MSQDTPPVLQVLHFLQPHFLLGHVVGVALNIIGRYCAAHSLDAVRHILRACRIAVKRAKWLSWFL